MRAHAQVHLQRLYDLHRPIPPALQPWVEYLKKLHPAERAIMLADMGKLGMVWGRVIERALR